MADLKENIEELILVQEMPFRSLAVLSQYLIYKEVAKDGKVKVLLNGQGADEIFTGYTEHYCYYFLDLLVAFKWKSLFHEFKAFCKNKNKSTLSGAIFVAKTISANFIDRNDKYRFFKKSFVREKESTRKNEFTHLKNRLYRNLTFSALREYLRYDDRNSMCFSLESRLPFLDPLLVTKAFSIADSQLIVDGYTKFPLRKASVGKVAQSIVDRKDKMGFVSPQEEWQKTLLAPEFDEVFFFFFEKGIFPFIDTSSIKNCFQRYKEGKHNDWALFWRIYCLYKWKVLWIGNVNNGG